MIKTGAEFKIAKDNMDKLFQGLKGLANKEVYVGIPEEKAARQGETITNAQLAFIHTNGVRSKAMRAEMQPELDKGTPYSKAYQMYLQEHGSPAWHVPPRPIIQPAIEANMETISGLLKQAAGHAAEGDIEAAEQELKKAGMAGAKAAQDWFTDPRNNWPPNAQATIKAKRSDRPLIDTGALRKSITFVVRNKGG